MAGGLREALARIYDEGENLQRVAVLRFGGDPAFVTAIRFQFERLVVTFRAVADDDTVAAELGEGSPGDDGVWADVSGQPVWSECLGCHVAWAWEMNNQQGYTDGVRFEFEVGDGSDPRIVELVVVASSFKAYTVRPC